MANMSELLRGHTDTILLAQLAGGDSYGYRLGRSVSSLTAGALELKEATLYTAFRRLEQAGHITSYWGDDATGGARRRYYSITEDGRKALEEGRRQWETVRDMLDALLDGKE